MIYNNGLGKYANGDGLPLPMHRPDFEGNATHGFTRWGRSLWNSANRWALCLVIS